MRGMVARARGSAMPFYELFSRLYELLGSKELCLPLPLSLRASAMRAWVGAWAMRGAYGLNA